MKNLILITMIIFSFGLFAKEKAAAKNTKAKMAANAKTAAPAANAEAPCDSKEDILKKLEEKKKAESASAAPKGFSLQGGDTGCSIK